tara:strand:+ start:391 stop:699 length:309 start_codon:yes stop_codon:yes gene_type:complete
MSKIKSIIERQRESGSGAPFKYYVDERAGDTSQIISQNIEGAVAGGLKTAADQGVAKEPAKAKCPEGMVMDLNGKCKKAKEEDKTVDLTVDTDNLAGNTGDE